MRRRAITIFSMGLALGGAGTATAQETCAPNSALALRVGLPDVPLDTAKLSWEGNADCSAEGEKLKALLDGGYVKIGFPKVESDETGNVGPITITASKSSDDTQEVEVELRPREPDFDPKLFFYFEKVEKKDTDALNKVDRYLIDGKIYQAFYLSRQLIGSDVVNVNIKLVATYFYYQAAIQIDTSQRFSKGNLKISTDARKRMVAVIKAIENPADADHEAYSQAYRNKKTLLRDLKDIKTELGFKS